MPLLNPVNVQRFNIDPAHPFYDASLVEQSRSWVIMVNDRECLHCVGFDKTNKVAICYAMDSAGKMIVDKRFKRWRPKMIRRKGVISVFARND